MNEITRVLIAIEQGEPGAASQLLPLVYDQLRLLAAHKLAKEKPGQTLDATALVHEAYLRMVETDSPRSFRDHNHFFAAAASAMRRILIDNARYKLAHKHGGGADEDLNGARAENALAGLTEPKRRDWQRLWEAVEDLRRTAA